MIQNPKWLVGRSRELVELEGGLEQALSGTGGLFLLVGEPGIGKTRVADELGRRAKERDFAVHWGRCWEVGGAPAFWPWIQIFRSMLRDPRTKPLASAYGDVLARLLPELRTAGVAAPQELDGAQARFQLFDELWGLLRAVAEQIPLVLVLDDLHAADPSSLAFLQFVVRDLRSDRVVVVVTYRDREAKPIAEVAETIRAITRDGTFLPLRRLDLAEVEQFLERRAGRALAPELARALHTATEGNPMFVDQAFRMLEARSALGAPVATVPIPDGMRDMIKKRLGSLDPSTRELLDASAVLGREFTRSLLAAVCQRTESDLRGPLESVLESGIIAEPILGTYEFSHALFREALYRDLPEGARAKLHARVAESLEASNAPERAVGEIAAHLLGAASVVGPERALQGSMRAGRRALDALAFEDAAAILSMAVDQIGVPADGQVLRGRALVMAGEAHARAGHYDRARKACDEAATIARRSGDPTLLAEAALALGVEIVPGVITAPLVALLQEAHQSLPPAASPLRAKVLARLAAALQPAPNPEEPMAIAREAVTMARSLGDLATLRACLHMGGSALVDYADPKERWTWDDELLRLSTDAGDVIAVLRAHARLIFDYLELGQPEEADAQIALHGKLADELGLPRYQWLTLMLLSLRAISQGNFEESDGLRERARRIAQRTKAPEMDVAFYLQAWGAALTKGEPLPYIGEIIEATAHFPGSTTMNLAMRTFEHARLGQIDVARSLLAQVPEISPLLTCAGPHLRFLGEACVRVQDPVRAAVIYRTMEPMADRVFSWGRVGMAIEGPSTWLLGMLAGVMGRWDDAARHFEEALLQSTRAGLRPYEAFTCLEYARMLARRGERSEKFKALLGRGGSIAQELGMNGVVRDFQDLAGGSTAQPAAGGDLSAIARETAAPPPGAEAAPLFSLENDGELWTCKSGDRSFRLKDSRGVQMLAELLRHPGREFHVLTLIGSEAIDTGDAGEVIDREAAQAYREHVEDLRDQISEAESWGDTARAEGLRRKLDAIAAELARGVGLGGRSRRSGAAAERARVNVQRRLRDAIKRIADQDARLGRHLDRTVRTGTFCAYEPA